MQTERPIKSDWRALKRGMADEVKIPTFLFVLCKSVTEDSSGGLFLNGTIVQRTLWEGEPPPCDKGDKPYFQVALKGPLAGGELEERRWENTTTADDDSKMVYATINLSEAPIDIRPKWNLFPFGIYTGTVELELQVRLVSEREETLRSDTGDDAAHVRDEKEEVLVSECKRTLCPDICNATTLVRGDEEGRDRDETEEHRVGRLVKVKKDMSRCRSLGFLRKMPTIEICGDKRECARVNADDPTAAKPTFTTYPQMKLTFWLHEPVSKAMFKIFGPLLLVVTLMLVNFHQAYGFDRPEDWVDDEGRSKTNDYLQNVISIGIAAVVVIPSIRSSSINSSVQSFTIDDVYAIVFVMGLALSAMPHPVVALIGCVLSCAVVFAALVSYGVYKRKCKKIVEEQFSIPVRVTPAEKVKPSAKNFKTKGWVRVVEPTREEGDGAAPPCGRRCGTGAWAPCGCVRASLGGHAA